MNIPVHCIRSVPVILVMGTIFFLSHQSGVELHLPTIPGLDKLAHGVMYALLSAALIHAAPEKIRRSKPFRTGIVVVLFCLLYGMTDEYHQSFIPGREASLADLVADGTGAAVFVFLWFACLRPGTVREPAS